MGTITKALNLLNYFSTSRAEISLAEFKLLSGQDKATVHRHLGELQLNGFIEQNPVDKSYRLGPAVLRLAAVRELTFPARHAVAATVDALSKELGELVHTSLFQRDGMSSLYHADVQVHGTRVYFDEAELLPLHATASGLTMLAFGPDSLLESVLKNPLEDYTGLTMTNPDTLKAAVMDIRNTGFAICDQGFEKEVYSIAAPIFAETLDAVGALAVAVPGSRMTCALQGQIINALKTGSDDVCHALGGAIPGALNTLWNHAA
jgi:DNA-binding IclR family transcriptional regulator